MERQRIFRSPDTLNAQVRRELLKISTIIGLSDIPRVISAASGWDTSIRKLFPHIREINATGYGMR